MTLENPSARKSDRILVLRPIDGTKPKSSTGLVDPRLFNGTNALHAIQDPRTCNWYFKYEQGGLPEPLKQRFTSFNLALEHARVYYKSRNTQIVEVID